MAIGRDINCIYGILERCFEMFIKLNQINERKTSEDLTVSKLTKMIVQGNAYKCLFFIFGFKPRGFLDGSFDFCQVSR